MDEAATIDRPKLDTLLATVVESPRALAALHRAQLRTLGDVVAQGGLHSLRSIKFVGEGTLSLIAKALGPIPDPEPAESEVEEGPHPIRLESPVRELRISLLPAHQRVGPGGVRVVERPHYLEFSDGEGTLTKRAWLTRIYERNLERIQAAMADDQFAWRRQAAEWLRGLAIYQRGEFRILEG